MFCRLENKIGHRFNLGIQQCDEGNMAIRIGTTVKSSTK